MRAGPGWGAPVTAGGTGAYPGLWTPKSRSIKEPSVTLHFTESCWVDLWIFFHHPLSETRRLLQSHHSGSQDGRMFLSWPWSGLLYWAFDICWHICCCLVAKSRLTLCDPVDCSTPGFPVVHYLLEFAQTHVH